MGEKLTGFELLLVLGAAFLIGFYSHLPLLGVAAVVGYFIYRFSKSNGNRTAFQKNYKKKNVDAFNALGSTKEEREKNIKKMFEENQATIKSSFLYSYKYLTVDHDIWFTQSRNLSIMEPREREFLKATFVLYNNNLITSENFSYYLYAFVNGNGKAAIDEIGWKHYYQLFAKAENNHAAITYMNQNCFNDNQTAIKFSQNVNDTSVDSAITKLMTKMQNIKE